MPDAYPGAIETKTFTVENKGTDGYYEFRNVAVGRHHISVWYDGVELARKEIIIAVIIILLIIVLFYLRKSIERSQSVVDVYLKKRYDVIPNLVEIIKGYSKYEE